MDLERIRTLLLRLPVTIALTMATVAVFLLELKLGGDGSLRVLMRMGAMHSERLVQGESWRLITAMFLHAGWIHFTLNLLALVQLAALVELMFGSHRLMGFFLVTGLVANLTSALANPAWMVGQVGVSGALFGLVGLVMGVALYGPEEWRDVLAQPFRALTFAVSLSISFLIAQVLFGLPFLIDHWAHFGGFVTGLLLAAAYPQPEAPTVLAERVLAFASAGALVGALGAAIAWGGNALEDLPDEVKRSFDQRIAAQEEGVIRGALIAGARSALEDAHYPDVETVFRGYVSESGPDTIPIVVTSLMQEEGADSALIWACEEWLALDPDDPQALNSLAWHLLVHADTAKREPARALVLIDHALGQVGAWLEAAHEENAAYVKELDPLSKGIVSMRTQVLGGMASEDSVRASFLDTRAEALFQLERVDEALEVQTEAVALGEAAGSPELDEMKARLERIQASSR